MKKNKEKSSDECIKTLTCGLGKIMFLKDGVLLPATDKARHFIYIALAGISRTLALSINIQNAKRYAMEVLKMSEEQSQQLMPNLSLLRYEMKKLGDPYIQTMAGSIASQAYAQGTKPDFSGKHREKLILKGESQIPLHKTNGSHPIYQRSAETKLFYINGCYYLAIQMFAINCLDTPIFKENKILSNWIVFSIKIKKRDKKRREEFSKIICGEWDLRSSKIMRSSRPKGPKWMGQVVVRYKLQPSPKMDANIVAGIDMGVTIPACIHIRKNGIGENWAMCIGKGEVLFRARSIVRSEITHILRALKSKESPLDEKLRQCYLEKLKCLRKRESRIMKTATRNIAATIAKIAIRHGAGTWQIEDLSTDIKVDKPWLARNWAPGMLKDAIRWQANQVGAKIVFVNPAYTSQRCSKCGHISSDNRPKKNKGSSYFQCIMCGYKDHADKNAARNLSIVNVDEIIEKFMAPNGAVHRVETAE